MEIAGKDSLLSSSLSTASMSSLPPERRGEGTGYFSLSTASATAIGPFLALFLTHRYRYTAIFINCIVFSALALLFALFGKVKEAELTDEQRASMRHGFRLGDFFENLQFQLAIRTNRWIPRHVRDFSCHRLVLSLLLLPCTWT